MISIDNLSAWYDNTMVLEKLSVDIAQGETYVLLGPSGCGKSTLIKILCNIHKQFIGSILYNGQPLTQQKLNIGYVPQTYGLLEWKTVKDNIFLPARLDAKKACSKTESNQILEILEIKELLNRYPLQLSGGQRQRVALARAFVLQPDLLLMDEPFSSLDSFTSVRSQELFLRLWNKYKITTVVITHNISEAVNVAKHILLMDKNPGRIISQIDNKTFGTSDNLLKLEQTQRILEAFKSIAE